MIEKRSRRDGTIAPPPPCELRLFGEGLSLRLPGGGAERRRFTSRKPAELLALVACGVGAERAKALLWPDDRAREDCLKQTARVLRRDLEKAGAAGLLSAPRSPLSLSEGVTTDVAAFEDACRLAMAPDTELEAGLAAARAAKEIRARGFLAGHAAGEPAFAAWLREQRAAFDARLSRASAGVFELLFERAAAAMRAGDLGAAERLARACLELKGDSPEPRWALMRLYAIRGRPSLVDEVYEELRRSASAAVGRPPTQEEADTHRMLAAEARRCMVQNCVGAGGGGTPSDPRELSLSASEREAGRLYAQGRALWRERLKGPLAQSEARFREAIAAHEEYAPAHSGLADALALQAYYGLARPQKAYQEAVRSAKRALLLDPGLAEAHTSVGWLDLVYRWDWAQAERSFLRALELDPSYETAHQWYSFYLMLMRRTPESAVEIGLARQLNRHAAIYSKSVGQRYYHEGRYGEARRAFEGTLRETPGFSLTHFLLAQTLEQLGLQEQQRRRREEEGEEERRDAADDGGEAEPAAEADAYLRRAVEEFETALELARADGLFADSIEAGLAHAHASRGRSEEAGRIRDGLLERRRDQEDGYVSPFALAVCCLAAGEAEQALAWLRQGAAERPGDMVLVHIDPRFAGLRKDSKEFRRILTEEMGLS